MSRDEFVIEKGSLDGSEPIVLVKNNRTWNDNQQPCPHCHSPIKIVHTRSDLSTWDKISWTNPFEALIPYDGDCCQTGICVKCLLDGVVNSGFDIDSVKEHKITKLNDIPVFTEISTYLLEQQGWQGNKGCIWTKGINRLAYEKNKDDNLSWNLDGKEVEFMEELNQTQENEQWRYM